jgi:hypothetical protein
LRLRELLGRDSTAFPWQRALLFALALQMRSSLLLLGVWLSQLAQGLLPFVSRLRVMPAHPDWYLSALIENVAIGLALVWISRRLAIGWAVPLAALAGAAAWLVASTHLAASPVEGFVQVMRPVMDAIDTILFLGTLAALAALLRWSWGVVIASTTAGALCGVARLLLTYSVWGAPWIETWRVDLVVEAVSGAACGLTLLILAASTGRCAAARRSPSADWYLATHGLSVLSLVYLQLAMRFSGWQLVATPPLLWTIGGLTSIGYIALFSVLRALRSNARLFRSCVALELCALAFFGVRARTLALGALVDRGLGPDPLARAWHPRRSASARGARHCRVRARARLSKGTARRQPSPDYNDWPRRASSAAR